MGSLFEKSRSPRNTKQHKAPSKGQRLGWEHKSEYAPVRLSNLSAKGEKLHTYTSGPFSTNKLVP